MYSGYSSIKQKEILGPFANFLLKNTIYNKPVFKNGVFALDDAGDYQIGVASIRDKGVIFLAIQLMPGGDSLKVQYTFPLLSTKTSNDKLENVVNNFNSGIPYGYSADFGRLSDGGYSLWIDVLHPYTTFSENTFGVTLTSIHELVARLAKKLYAEGII